MPALWLQSTLLSHLHRKSCESVWRLLVSIIYAVWFPSEYTYLSLTIPFHLCGLYQFTLINSPDLIQQLFVSYSFFTANTVIRYPQQINTITVLISLHHSRYKLPHFISSRGHRAVVYAWLFNTNSSSLIQVAVAWLRSVLRHSTLTSIYRLYTIFFWKL